jgi:uncharacterized membrane protein HdeD (DUF308 family)
VNLLMGILYLVFGGLLMSNPGLGAMSLTLLISAFLGVGGIFRIAVSAVTRIQHWGWFLLSGLLSLLLGGLIWYQWPISGLFIIGVYVGNELIMAGVTLLSLAIATRNPKRFHTV